MDSPLISVIIPVFNPGNRLIGCLDSVLHQSFCDFEIVLIDDCSTDDSLSVCRQYASHDNRIRFFKNEHNIGCSQTRNKGIELSKGEFVTFVDNDDIVDENYLTCFVNNISKANQGNLLTQQAHIVIPGVEDRLSTGFHILGAVWTKLYKREILINNNIRFIPDLRFSEDTFFNLDYLNAVNSYYEIEEFHYCWTLNNSSTSNKRYSDYDAFQTSLLLLFDYIETHRYRNQIVFEYIEYYICFVFHYYIKSLYSISNANARKRYKSIKTIFNTNKRLALRYFPLQFKADRLICFLFKMHLYFIGDILNKGIWRLRK